MLGTKSVVDARGAALDAARYCISRAWEDTRAFCLKVLFIPPPRLHSFPRLNATRRRASRQSRRAAINE